MNNVINTEVVIVGAGPGGVATSLSLSKEKIPHLILDKASFPRDKICGDALGPFVSSVIKKINPLYELELHSDNQKFLPFPGVQFISPNGQRLDIPYRIGRNGSGFTKGFTIKRMDFDNFLVKKLDKKYSSFFPETEVNKIENKNGSVEVYASQNSRAITIKSKIIIGADGERSVVAKHLAKHTRTKNHFCGGIRTYYKNISGFHKENYIELHFYKELLPGYFWIFPLPNGYANVGLAILSDVISRKKMNLKKMLKEIILGHPLVRQRFENAECVDDVKGWGLPLGSVRKNISGKNFFLVGDAASLIDPFSGEGIGNAMFSGMVAATHVKKRLEENRFDENIMKQYDKEIFTRIGKELKISHFVQKLINSPRFLNFIINKASKNEELGFLLSSMVSNSQERKKLKNPFFYLRVLFT